MAEKKARKHKFIKAKEREHSKVSEAPRSEPAHKKPRDRYAAKTVRRA